MKKLFIFCALIGLLGSLSAQALYKTSYALQGEEDPFAGGLLGNGIVDLVPQDSLIWAATGYGLNKGMFNQQTQNWEWQTFKTEQYIGKGGVSAMGFMDDKTLWIATAFDTMAQEEELPAGSGLSYTSDGGETWTHVQQPVDSPDEDRYAPTTTAIQNLIYDIAFVDSTIWIASFGGGLRRSDDMGQTWQVVTTDGVFFSSLANLNHRAFSLLSVGDTLWVGTAAGISKTFDNGQTWERFVFNKENTQSISGNFVVALAYQEFTNTVWAATVQAEDQDEARGISRTSDGGQTWERLLEDEQIFPHNFAFNLDAIYVPADLGLYFSEDNGQTWDVITDISDYNSGEEIFQDEYYSAAVQTHAAQSRLWLGGSDGLATKLLQNGPDNWTVIRSYVSTKVRRDPKIYAYPSPFSPSRHLYIRFEYDSDKTLEDDIKIYDFAMDQVARIRINDLKPKWDGTNEAGDVVASGVYFFRAKIAGEVTWGKIIVIN